MIEPQMGAERDVVEFMRDLAEVTHQRVPALPGPETVLLKARLVRQWEAERRAERPLEMMQAIHLALGAAAAMVLLVWSAPLLSSLF